MPAKRVYKTTYDKWVEQQEIPIARGVGLEDVTQIPRKFWPHIGGPAAFINLDAIEGRLGIWLVEIPPGGALNVERHLYEEIVYILKGSGFTEIGLKGKKRTFEWKERSLFNSPLNTWHRLVNGTPEPALVLMVSNAPLMIDVFHNLDFIFHNDFEFKDRYQEQEDFFAGEGKRHQLGVVGYNLWETNFIPDVLSARLESFEVKVTKGALTGYQMSGSVMAGHITEWPVGVYHKAHCHSGGLVIIAVSSKGYWLTWPPEAGVKPYQNGKEDAVIKIDFKPGSIYGPSMFHQRFNTGPEPARQLMIASASSRIHSVGAFKNTGELEDALFISTRQGGTLIEYEDEDPEIRRRFEEALRQGGIKSRMPPVVYRD